MDVWDVWRQVHGVAQQALDIAFPPQCAGCKRTGAILCSTCLVSMQPRTPLPCRKGWRALSGVFAVNVYQGSLRTCIHALKYEGITRLAPPLGALLTQCYLHNNMQADMLIPVPLHSQRHKLRGYNHAYLLSHVCSSQVNIPLRNDILIRSRATTAQVGLNVYERQQNVMGAFSCMAKATTESVYRRTIIIVDDVCTTGATLDACAATLLQAGAASVWGLVLAGSVT